jgi:hypothetical protein
MPQHPYLTRLSLHIKKCDTSRQILFGAALSAAAMSIFQIRLEGRLTEPLAYRIIAQYENTAPYNIIMMMIIIIII